MKLSVKNLIPSTLVAVYFATFFLVRMWYAYEPLQLLIFYITSIVGVSVFSIISATVVSFTLSRTKKYSAYDLEFILKNTTLIASVYFVGYVIVTFLYGNHSVIDERKLMWLPLKLFLVVFIISLIASMFKIYFKPIFYRRFNFIVCILIAFNFITILYSNYYNKKYTITKNSTEEKLYFKHKPNIYLLVLESHTNKFALNNIYGIDDESIYGKLPDYGFTFYDTALSNYQSSLASILAMFTMRHHYYNDAVGRHDVKRAKEIIGGNEENVIFKILRNNNYKIQFIHKSNYIFNEVMSDIYYHPTNPIFSAPFREIFKARKTWDKTHENFVAKIKERVAIASRSNEPFFTFVKTQMPGHSNDKHKWFELDYFNDEYAEQHKKAMITLDKIVSNIIDTDPNSLILLIGDHGARRYNRLEYYGSNPNDAIEKNGVTSEEYNADRFGIMAAIRFPRDLTDIVPIQEFCQVNLFREIYARLSEDYRLLDYREKNITILKHKKDIYVTAKNNKALKRFIILNEYLNKERE